MALTDQDVLDTIQGYMLEPQDGGLTWGSGFWTVDEVIGYLNNRQRELLVKTACVLLRDDATPVVANALRTSVPTAMIELRFVAFHAQDGSFWPIPRADPLQADLYRPDWTYNAKQIPDAYSTAETPNLQLELLPASTLGGVLDLLGIPVARALSNNGQAFAVPDDLTDTILFGAMADMWKKPGRATSDERAAYCEQRWRMGVELVNLLLDGGA